MKSLSLNRDLPKLWELLVTDGHVRAARLRSLQIPIFVLGVALTLGAAYFGTMLPQSPGFTPRAQLVQERLEKRRATAVAAVSSLPEVRTSFETLQSLPRKEELATVYRAVLGSLQQTGELPSDLRFEMRTREDFWRRQWPHGQIAAVQGNDVWVLGALVADADADLAAEQSSPALRWVGVFRRIGEQWHGVNLQVDNGFTVAEEPSLTAEQLPLTLSATHRN